MTYAIYDEQRNKLRGGFITKQSAKDYRKKLRLSSQEELKVDRDEVELN